MKKYLTALISLILIMAFIPIAADKNFFKNILTGSSTETITNSIITASKDSNYNIPENVAFIDTSSNKEISRSAKSVLYSLVGAAVNEDFTENEVKALSVAFHTQLCRENDSHNLSIDTQNPDIFLNENSLKEKFGKNYTTLCSYCDNVYNSLILISDKPADLNIEYLKNETNTSTSAIYKASPYSSVSSDYSITLSVSKDEFFGKLKEINPDLNTSIAPQNAVGKITYLNSGEVDTVNICGENFSGEDIVNAFSLPYSRFTLIYSLNEFRFNSLKCDVSNHITADTAKFMSLQGNTYDEILNYCYSY